MSGAFAEAGESKLEEVLQSLHDKHPDQWKAAIHGGRALVNGLKPIVEKSVNKIDDAFLDALSGAIEDSAKSNAGTLN